MSFFQRRENKTKYTVKRIQIVRINDINLSSSSCSLESHKRRRYSRMRSAWRRGAAGLEAGDCRNCCRQITRMPKDGISFAFKGLQLLQKSVHVD